MKQPPGQYVLPAEVLGPAGPIGAEALHDPGGRSKPKWRPGATVVARFSECGKYRYELSEIWDQKRPLVMFLMMNPSVAGVEFSDPTLMRTGMFARDWEYGGQLVGNVHAYRITQSKRLLEVDDPIGPENDQALLSMALRVEKVVLAFGLPPKPLRPRADRVVRQLAGAGARLTYLQLTKEGTPRHPLYLKGDLKPQEYSQNGRRH